jgi:NYN domain
MAGTRVVIDVDNVLYWCPPRSVATLTDLVEAIRERFGAAADIRLVATETPTSDTAALRDEATRVGAQLTMVPPGRGSSVDVVLAVQVMEAIPDGVERLVFASLDHDLVAVIAALKRAGIYTILLSPPDHLPLQFALAADELIDMIELSYVAQGLIGPESKTRATRAITEQFGRATREIVIIDPYVGSGTIKLLAWVPSTVDITVVGSRIEDMAVVEARTLRAHGRRIRVVRVPARAMPHDRWFRIDDAWWHSGASLKDLGRRFSRISRVDHAESTGHDEMLAQLLQEGTDLL